MEIIVNCNDDSIIIVTRNDKIVIEEVQVLCRYPYQTCKILEEIFNRMFDIDGQRAPYVELTLINEDSRKQIGEW